MTKKVKKTNKILEVNSLEDIRSNPNSISSLQSLHIILNELYKGINHLEDEYIILKHRLKSKLFSQLGVNVSNFLNIEYLEKFLNKNSDALSSYFHETIQLINMFSLEVDPKIIESIAKHAYLIFKKQSELKIHDLNQLKLNNQYFSSNSLKDSSEFKILSELNNESPIPFLKTIINAKYSQSIIHWQEFTYLYSQKKIILIDSNKDKFEKYYIDRASNSEFSSINDNVKQIWIFNKNIWSCAKKYLENNDSPPNDVKISFPFFNRHNNN
ncbi:MAG: hypothetical protein HeimC3_17780 [Candidatus Heimdallarchaeota archaeon LC_3]|nr:MAG: hypothetical protein HeimC3_17780 [Candidatus Heimdallarchaeota archaeon LC_3]